MRNNAGNLMHFQIHVNSILDSANNRSIVMMIPEHEQTVYFVIRPN